MLLRSGLAKTQNSSLQNHSSWADWFSEANFGNNPLISASNI